MNLPALDQAFSYYPRLAKLRRYVRAHLREDLSLPVAARIVGLESKYFSAYFKQRVGVSFSEWVAWERADHARSLLMASDRRVTDVALSVGFKSLRTFERAFKRYYGTTPLEFKRTVRPSHER